MIPGPFEYHRPASLPEAVSLMASHGDEALVIAGGHSLIPMMKLRMAAPGHLVDLQDLDDLKGIAVAEGQIRIGAMTTQHDLIDSEALSGACPIIRETALQIADPQVRYVGTFGGNIANGDPGNDMPALMQVLDATYHLKGPDGDRTVQARDFYQGAYFTAREDGEILTQVSFAAPPAGHGSAYMKQKRKIGDYATAAAAVVLTLSGGTCTAASIGLTNLSETPLFVEAAGAALVGTTLDSTAVAEAVAAAKAVCNPAEDGRGPKDFRTHVAGVMVQRAIETARTRAA